MFRLIPIFIAATLAAATPVLGAIGECPQGQPGPRCQAENGDAEAQFELGMLLLDGEIHDEDSLAGLKWIERAARQGHPQAAYVPDRVTLSSRPGQGCSGGL